MAVSPFRRLAAALALVAGLGLGSPINSAAAADMAAIEAAPVDARGSFSGASNHETRGSVKLVTVDGKHLLVLGQDFWFDGAPDPKWGFGKDGKFEAGTLISPLAQNAGEQVYEIPASINLADFDTVVLWCERFSVPLGQARLH